MFILNEKENGIVNLANVKEVRVEKVIDRYYIMADGVELINCHEEEVAEKIIWDIFQAMKNRDVTYHFIY